MAVSGKGTTFSLGSAGGSDLTEIGCLKSLTPPTSSVSDIDTTCLNDDVKTYLPGILDNGEISGVIQYESANYAALQAKVGVPDCSCQIDFSDNSSLSATGYLKELGPDAIEIDGIVTQSFKFKISGAITLG